MQEKVVTCIPVTPLDEQPDVILTNIKRHMPSWREATLAQLEIRRMNSFSNACYQVTFQDSTDKDKVLLYRKFLKLHNKETEAILFRYMSE